MVAMRCAWLTDIHLNFLKPEQIGTFFDAIAAAAPDAVLVSGDISVGATCGTLMDQLGERLQRPVYFVLGNHDFWERGSAEQWEAMTLLTEVSPFAHWLPAVGVAELTPTCGLVGHDGWYDGRAGDYDNSQVMMNDWVRMSDFAYQGKAGRLATMQTLATRAVEHIATVLPQALARYPEVICVTHVPPFAEAAWHDGRYSDDQWQPFTTSTVMGELLRAVMADHPDRRCTVLCGHTHGAGEFEAAPNLLVKTGAAVYRAPALQPLLEIA
jgi:3',5'-cyclic AMP phosphodiesterase CpdA